MKYAIYHGYPNFHFEMLGYIIEYFKSNDLLLNVDIYSYINIFSYEWWSYYNKLFDIKIKWINPTEFKPNLYEYVILITDDDILFDTLYLNSNIKIICIEHADFIKRINPYKRLGTRFFYKRPNNLWAIPCFNAININDKNTILNKENKINVILLGQTIPEKIEDLEDIFINFQNINFYIIIRKLNYYYNLTKYNNVIIYENCLTSIMLDILKKSHYVLCFDVNNDEHYISCVIAGAIHLSFSFGCQLIIPETWNNNYNFNSSINYTKNSKLLLDKNINLELVYNEKYELIHHRNIIFDNLISYKNKRINNLYNNIINNFNIIIPNICMSDIYIDNIINDYREFYLFNINKLSKIKEPILFIFNSIETINFELISNRIYIDIIITKNIIKEYYKRPNVYYVYNDLFITIPQR